MWRHVWTLCPHIKKTEGAKMDVRVKNKLEKGPEPGQSMFFSFWDIHLTISREERFWVYFNMGVGPNFCLLCLFHTLQCLPAADQKVHHDLYGKNQQQIPSQIILPSSCFLLICYGDMHPECAYRIQPPLQCIVKKKNENCMTLMLKMMVTA